jgi:hypothetical protein
MRAISLGFSLLVLAACGDSNGLPDPSLPNVERTEVLYALVGTPVTTPSAYSLEGSRRVRTDQEVNFDFAFDIDASGQAVLVPRAALGIDIEADVKPGLQIQTQTFEAITVAPSNGYITDQALPVAVGERYAARGRITCSIGVPKYAKLEVLVIDPTARTITFRILTDDNCGFRGLEPGLPDS